jgi:hypothetical protein
VPVSAVARRKARERSVSVGRGRRIRDWEDLSGWVEDIHMFEGFVLPDGEAHVDVDPTQDVRYEAHNRP